MMPVTAAGITYIPSSAGPQSLMPSRRGTVAPGKFSLAKYAPNVPAIAMISHSYESALLSYICTANPTASEMMTIPANAKKPMVCLLSLPGRDELVVDAANAFGRPCRFLGLSAVAVVLHVAGQRHVTVFHADLDVPGLDRDPARDALLDRGADLVVGGERRNDGDVV